MCHAPFDAVPLRAVTARQKSARNLGRDPRVSLADARSAHAKVRGSGGGRSGAGRDGCGRRMGRGLRRPPVHRGDRSADNDVGMPTPSPKPGFTRPAGGLRQLLCAARRPARPGARRRRPVRAFAIPSTGTAGCCTARSRLPRACAAVDAHRRRPAGRPRQARAADSGALTHSTTNTQVAGVDEPDIAKTDGRYLDQPRRPAAAHRRRPHRRSCARPSPFRSRAASCCSPVITSSCCPAESGSGNYPVVQRGRRRRVRPGAALPVRTALATTTLATVVDISNPDAPTGHSPLDASTPARSRPAS